MPGGGLRKRRYVVLGSDVAERDRCIASQPGPPRPHDGGASVELAECLARHLQEAMQRGVGVVHVAGEEGRVRLVRGRARIGADLLADVTAEDPVAEVRSQLARDRAALLDGLKRDAQRRMDRVRGDDRARRAAIETDAAPSAVLGQWLIGLEVEIEQQLAEHDPGAVPGYDDAGVLAVPAESGAGRD